MHRLLEKEFLVVLQVYQVLCKLPQIEMKFSMKGWWETGSGQQEEKFIDTARQGKCNM